MKLFSCEFSLSADLHFHNRPEGTNAKCTAGFLHVFVYPHVALLEKFNHFYCADYSNVYEATYIYRTGFPMRGVARALAGVGLRVTRPEHIIPSIILFRISQYSPLLLFPKLNLILTKQKPLRARCAGTHAHWHDVRVGYVRCGYVRTNQRYITLYIVHEIVFCKQHTISIYCCGLFDLSSYVSCVLLC